MRPPAEKLPRALTWLVLTIGTVLSSFGNDGASRTIQSLDQDWRFALGEHPAATYVSFRDENWKSVDVPHDYVIEGTFTQKIPDNKIDAQRADWHWLHGFLPVPPAVYRKTFNVPDSAAGKRLWLEFDGVVGNSRFWLNGKLIGSEYSPYSPVRLDVSSTIRAGANNILVVQVDPRYVGWWYEGGGIYRHVRLVTLSNLHVAPDGVYVIPQVTRLEKDGRADGVAEISTTLQNEGNSSSEFTLTSEILDAAGSVLGTISTKETLAAGASVTLKQQLQAPDCKLWSPETPHLYRLKTRVASQAYPVDETSTSFGFRSIRFDADHGFFLNEKHYVLKGVNMHQDHAGVGVAVPDRLFTWKLERLKQVGCNAIRMSHNPVSPYLMDECDRLGFLVIAENRFFGDAYTDQASEDTPAEVHKDLTAQVLRDRNHPSVFLWSICNEQWIGGTEGAARIARAMKQRIRELDTTRPVTAAMNAGFENKNGMIGELDVVGINYNPGTYDPVHKLFPHIPMLGSEIASEISTRGIYSLDTWENYYGVKEKGHISAYSISAGPGGQTVEKAWQPVVARNFLGGAFIWAAFDYKGEPRPFGWPVVNCNYGFMDLCGFPKDSYYYYKAVWTEEPVLHVFPHWNWSGREGQEILVWVHSNCEAVELLLNGKSLGVKTVTPNQHLEWKVPYAPGKLTARGVRHGQTYTEERTTTGPEANVKLQADRTSLTASGTDLSVVTVSVTDNEGRDVPTASNLVHFKITGPGKIIGVGNGDPSCHEPDKADSRSLFNGLAQVLVQTTQEGGAIELRASAEGLADAVVVLQSR